LSSVDAVFNLPGIPDGVLFDGQNIKHETWRRDEGGLVELWPPVVARPSDPPTSWKPPVERIRGDAPQTRLARLIAGRINRMLQDKELLEAKARAIEPGDIMILVRRRTGFVEDIVRSLKELDIRVAGVDRMVLTEQLAVMDLIAFGQFLLLPEDDLTFASLLKSPLFGLSEDQLFDLAYQRNSSLWQSLVKNNTRDPQLSLIYKELSYFLARVDFIPPFELYSELLGAYHGRKKLVSRLGPDALDPISEFLNLAFIYEKSHATSLEGFLHWVAVGEVEIKRDLEQATQNSVRVMTIHGAKGLQAPIIFLPDTLQVPIKGPRLLWPQDMDGNDQGVLWAPRQGLYGAVCQNEYEVFSQRRDEEYKRLLYVAMTRAEDRLYVCGWQTKNKPPENCWYNIIKSGLLGICDEVTDSYLKEADETSSSSVLRLSSQQNIEIKKRKKVLDLDYRNPPKWAFNLPAEDPLPPTVLTPSKPIGDEPVVLSPLQADDDDRFKRGQIIHKLLQTIPDLEPERQKQTINQFLGRKVYALSLVQREEIKDETLSVINDPDFSSVFGQGSRAEVPLSGLVNGQVISAQLDRLVVKSNEVFVVDFKTNRPPPTKPDKVAEIYLRQMALYRIALQNIYPGKNIRCALLWTVGAYLMPLGTEQLLKYTPDSF
jgi:ATP-dependent helicase/nuclease subunit A